MPDPDIDASFHILLKDNLSPMWAFDRETLAVLTVNDAAVRQYGYSRAEFLAMTLADIHPSEKIPGLSSSALFPATIASWTPSEPAYISIAKRMAH